MSQNTPTITIELRAVRAGVPGNSLLVSSVTFESVAPHISKKPVISVLLRTTVEKRKTWISSAPSIKELSISHEPVAVVSAMPISEEPTIARSELCESSTSCVEESLALGRSTVPVSSNSESRTDNWTCALPRELVSTSGKAGCPTPYTVRRSMVTTVSTEVSRSSRPGHEDMPALKV